MDDKLLRFLKKIDFNKTVVSIMSDHGNHMSSLQTHIGLDVSIERGLPINIVVGPKHSIPNKYLKRYISNKKNR